MKVKLSVAILGFFLAIPLASAAGSGTGWSPDIGPINQEFAHMQTLMNRAQKTHNTRKYQNLMREHLNAMRNTIAQMQDMTAGQGNTMGSGTAAGHSTVALAGRVPSAGAASAPKRPEMKNAQNRLDLMQKMMKQIIEQQAGMLRSG